MRKLTWLGGLILVPALLLTAYNATASASTPASEATEPQHRPLEVYGQDSWAMQQGIKYWNDLAGRKVISYAGPRMGVEAANDPHTVAVSVDSLPADTAGVTAGNVGHSALAITIDPRFLLQWIVYAHEFGHALGFAHDNGPSYNGVMSYASMWDPNPKADQTLWLSRQPDTH
jgi:hypothetical protein